MAQPAPQELMPSLLDRLIDPEAGGTSWRRGYGIEQMMDVVRRDLEDLLNTRQSHDPEKVAAFEEVSKSIVAYGLPDLQSLNAVTQSQRDDIGRTIEGLIARFEPRLKDIHASLVSRASETDKDRRVRFRIDAALCLDPAPEVAFDTVLELTSGHYSVTPSGAG